MSELIEPPKSERKILATTLKAIGAIAISVLALWWAAQGVDFAHVKEGLARTSFVAIAIYVLSLVVIHVSRVIRYGLLVMPLATLSWRAVFSAVSVGLPAAVFLPLRLGELVRPLMISRAGVPIAGAFASVVVERIVDGLWNLGVFIILLQLLPASSVPEQLKSAMIFPLVFFGGGIAFLVVAFLQRARMLTLLERAIGRFSPSLAAKVVALTSTFLDGLVAIGSWRRVAAFLALTAVYWTVNGWGAYYLANSYGVHVPLIAGPFAIATVVFAVTVPAGPAFAGVLEAGFRVGLAPFGVGASDAMLVALVAHVLQLVMLALYAFVGLQAAESSQRGKGVLG
ncbi:flippase-like domain-containing protein [Myxococcota bacterium]|nr:flippase-like domain-containing protein [Myxococcota bacterium]